MSTKHIFAVLALPLALVACDQAPTGSNLDSPVSVRFATAGDAASTSAEALVVEGSNGTLNITGIGFIVSELELERLESTCDNSGSGNLCDDFEAPISFVELPLPGGSVEVATDVVPHGQYDELDFEVENVEADSDDDSQKRQAIAALLNAIRTTHGFSDFPERASMVVEGTFVPTGSTEGTPFRVYFDAEIKVELRFDPALVINGNGASRALTVDVQPALWFKEADGTVMDLRELDYAQTTSVVEFEAEISKGFAKVELDD